MSATAPAGSSQRRPAYRRLSVEQRRAQLLDAAVVLFAHHSPEQVSLDGVAAAAGVSRPLVYRYFPGGKQQVYEAVLRTAADNLVARFAEPAEGSPLRRLASGLRRYLAFVDEYASGYAALMRGGCVAATSRTTATVDEVRQAAVEEILRHLEVDEAPPPRLQLAVRSWIACVEVAALTWLADERQPPAEELSTYLVDQFFGTLAVSAAGDEECADVARRMLEKESADGPLPDVLRRMLPLIEEAAPLLG